MIYRWLAALFFVASPGVCLAAPTLQAVGDETKGWKGKTVVLTARPQAPFMSWSAGKIALGVLLGSGAAAATGKQLVEQNGIENPGPKIAKTLLEAAQAHYDVIAAPIGPLSIDSTDAGAIARAGKGADLVFDVQPIRGSLEELLTRKGHYFVTSDVRFRVIEVASRRVLGDSTCSSTTQRDPDLPTKDELLADHAARLKAVLAAQRDFCVEFLEVQVLRLPAP